MRILAAIGVLALAGCSAAPAVTSTPSAEPVVSDVRAWPGWEPSANGDLTLESADFEPGGDLPQSMRLDRFSCDGPNIRPELHWSGLPEGTKSVAISLTIADGGGPPTRWLAFDIPPATTDLPAVAGGEPAVGKVARNDLGLTMIGPCVFIEDETWELWFTAYALDVELGFDTGIDLVSVITAGQGHVIEAAELNGFFGYAPQ